MVKMLIFFDINDDRFKWVLKERNWTVTHNVKYHTLNHWVKVQIYAKV